ncbi:hypothetical protein ACN28I_06160 [Archangium gephyra]|uniref:hypothetical protein n=1 Tax=Archangium gephyra TaxID=48 RepID=UPI003B7F83DC
MTGFFLATRCTASRMISEATAEPPGLATYSTTAFTLRVRPAARSAFTTVSEPAARPGAPLPGTIIPEMGTTPSRGLGRSGRQRTGGHGSRAR